MGSHFGTYELKQNANDETKEIHQNLVDQHNMIRILNGDNIYGEYTGSSKYCLGLEEASHGQKIKKQICDANNPLQKWKYDEDTLAIWSTAEVNKSGEPKFCLLGATQFKKTYLKLIACRRVKSPNMFIYNNGQLSMKSSKSRKKVLWWSPEEENLFMEVWRSERFGTLNFA